MTIDPLFLSQNDLQPYYRVTVKDADGNPVDLTGAQIFCTMKLEGATTAKISHSSSGITIEDQTTKKGQFYYAWQSGETDTASPANTAPEYAIYKNRTPYLIEFEIQPQAGGKFTVPSPGEGPATVVIVPDLDSQ